MDDYERVLMVKPDVFIYKIPPRASNRQYRAADWKLDEPNWSGRLRLVTKGSDCTIKLEDKITGELFAKCPIDDYPGIAIEAVSDSSRYFVIRLQDDNGRNAFIGMGFADRGDSFDMNVALQDHFKSLKTEEEISKEPIGETPKLDLGFKEGQTIKVNLNISKKSGNDGSTRARSKSSAGGSGGICILPPPPGGVKIPGPSVNKSADASPESAKPSQRTQMSDNDFLVDFGSLNINSNDNLQKKIDSNTETDLWSDFTSSVKTNDTKTDSNSWAQF